MATSFWTPNSLDSGVYGFTNYDIFFLEVCTLDAICDNRDRIWELERGEEFHCDLSEDAFRSFQHKLLQPAEAPRLEPTI